MTEDEVGGAVTTDYYWAPIPEALLYDDRVGHLAVRVYGVLMRHGLEPSSCYPKHERIAKLIGIEKRSVQRPLRELEQLGWIKRQIRWSNRGDRIADGWHVYSSPRPPAQEDAPTAQESAEGTPDTDRAGERDGYRAGERDLDRAAERAQEGEPENESQIKESHPVQELASTTARSEDDGHAGFADRARDAAVAMARGEVDWRVRAGKHVADPAGLAVHIAVNDVWPIHGATLAAIAAGNPGWTAEQIAESMADTGGSAAGTSAAVYRRAEEARREWDSTPVELPDPDSIQRHAAAARAALANTRPSEP